jgi:hypothetical protein
MPTFRRIKIQATVETEAMLLPDDEIDAALGELRDKLKRLDLAILSVGPAEPPPIQLPETSSDDPWSIRGQPVE